MSAWLWPSQLELSMHKGKGNRKRLVSATAAFLEPVSVDPGRLGVVYWGGPQGALALVVPPLP